MTFDEALEAHLRAILERNLGALAATVSGDDVVLVTSAGEVSTDRDHFLALHGGTRRTASRSARRAS